jgi:MFS family permease
MLTHKISIGNTLATVGVIEESLGITNEDQLSWLIAGYGLAIGTFILIGGRLGDEFGNKRMLIIGMAWYSLWSLIACLSVYSSHVLFILCRIV